MRGRGGGDGADRPAPLLYFVDCNLMEVLCIALPLSQQPTL